MAKCESDAVALHQPGTNFPSFWNQKSRETSINPQLTPENFSHIVSNLNAEDLWKLKILLCSLVPQKDVKTSKTVSELLEHARKLSTSHEDFVFIIAELLFTIKRYDLLKKTGCCKHQVGSYFDVHSKLDNLWVTRYNLGENLEKADPDDILRTLLPDDVSCESVGEVTDKHNELDLPGLYYSLNGSPCGYCVIINNEQFTDPQYPHRTGSSKDKEALKNLFGNFDFEVNSYDNQTGSQMKEIIMNLSKKNYKKYDCFVCCILSHGTRGVIFGSDGSKVVIEDHILAQFSGAKCRTLIGKPKLFIVQACQGESNLSGVIPHVGGDVEDDGVLTKPDRCDQLLYMATIPGYAAFRSKTQGAWFISHLTQMLDDHGHNVELYQIFTLVNRKVSELCSNERKQMPIFSSTLTKLFKFKRKRQPEEA